jgi:putative membrane-bound dehydrogenase-like protein
MRQVWWSVGLLTMLVATSDSSAQQPKPVIPHAQDAPPNEPRDPETAAKMMTVPEGFSVEVVASEPDIVNPVAMAIDERGRFWITESLEYPRREPGPGKDRVKILEDTDGDGKMDKFTVFLDGLNIPSGVAVGHGGVWIANSPDILFVPDADRDGKPDGPAQVVVTGFGRTDTHELPNSLTWGPDGWLYGLNGVFNHSHVKYPKENPNFNDDHKGWPLTCAMFRIHPRTREFQIFCEGTSNPWGIAFNDEGEAFVSACVIDHLWHLVETGYYHRQGGPYPPFTWKIESIVKHKHQKAAYCGIHYFDSDAYPEKYRGKLFMGNIHGGCINVDRIERDGSTYKGFGEPDFLTANDAWFMPVVQKTGPDGCLYILDWYDRYHCYQDANRDPAGIDRLKGRLYRVRYNGDANTKGTGAGREGEVPAESRSSNDPQSATKNGSAGASPSQVARRYPQIDLAKETDEQLIERLGAKNDFIHWTATRLLQERNPPNSKERLERLVFDGEQTQRVRLHALWSMAGMNEFGEEFLEKLIRLHAKNPKEQRRDAPLRAWGVRLLGNQRSIQRTGLISTMWDAAVDPAHEVRLQVVIAQSKIDWPARQNPRGTAQTRMESWVNILAETPDDELIARIVWQNLHPRLEEDFDLFIERLEVDVSAERQIAVLMPRVTDRILGRQKFDATPVAQLFALLRDDHPQVAKQVLEVISAKVQSGELKGEKLDQLKAAMAEPMAPLLVTPLQTLTPDAALLATSWGDPKGLELVRSWYATAGLELDLRRPALNALVAAKDPQLIEATGQILSSEYGPDPRDNPDSSGADFRADILAALGRLSDPRVAEVVLANYARLTPELQPRAIELLTQRAEWASSLLKAIGGKKLAPSVININQARRLKELKDDELTKLLATHWGQVRDGRDPNREKYIAEMKSLIRKTPGDPLAGEKAFKKVCAQCHKLYGEGAEVGPDITLNGRNDFTQLLSNVFDPSLVIGAGYRSYTVVTNGGRVLNGLLAEDSPQRVVLKVQGGKQEVIARGDIDEFKVSEISLMPEQLEKQLSQQEIIDLFAFITLDKHPSDPNAKRLPGVTAVTPRESTNPADFPAMVGEILPGFTTNASGVGGIALLNNHFGRDSVLRTHPVSREQPCTLTMKLTPPADKKTRLILDVSPDPRGDWRLVVRGNGQRMADEMISKETCPNGWRTLTIDLTKFAGQELTLGLVNQANDWSYEFGYWGETRIVSE